MLGATSHEAWGVGKGILHRWRDREERVVPQQNTSLNAIDLAYNDYFRFRIDTFFYIRDAKKGRDNSPVHPLVMPV